VRRLSDNAGIATMLATSEATRGDWRALINEVDALGKVTADQVQIAALKYFVSARRTAVYMVPPAAAKGGAL
jgi:predicted Zn-dependent peptidase